MDVSGAGATQGPEAARGAEAGPNILDTVIAFMLQAIATYMDGLTRPGGLVDQVQQASKVSSAMSDLELLFKGDIKDASQLDTIGLSWGETNKLLNEAQATPASKRTPIQKELLATFGPSSKRTPVYAAINQFVGQAAAANETPKGSQQRKDLVGKDLTALRDVLKKYPEANTTIKTLASSTQAMTVILENKAKMAIQNVNQMVKYISKITKMMFDVDRKILQRTVT